MLKTKFALMLVLVILLGSLIVNAYFLAQLCSFNTENNGVQKQVDDFRYHIVDLQNEKANLQSQLQTHQSKANPPELVTRLGVKDIRASPYANHPWSGRIRFYVAGEVWNVGQISAFNCKLHVVLYQGATVANDTYVMLGTIKPGSFVDVSADIFYEGAALTSWIVLPEIG